MWGQFYNESGVASSARNRTNYRVLPDWSLVELIYLVDIYELTISLFFHRHRIIALLPAG